MYMVSNDANLRRIEEDANGELTSTYSFGVPMPQASRNTARGFIKQAPAVAGSMKYSATQLTGR